MINAFRFILRVYHNHIRELQTPFLLTCSWRSVRRNWAKEHSWLKKKKKNEKWGRVEAPASTLTKSSFDFLAPAAILRSCWQFRTSRPTESPEQATWYRKSLHLIYFSIVFYSQFETELNYQDEQVKIRWKYKMKNTEIILSSKKQWHPQ